MSFNMELFFLSDDYEFLNFLSNGIYVLDKNGQYIFANTAALNMAGMTLEEIKAGNVFDLKENKTLDFSAAIKAYQEKDCVSCMNTLTLSPNKSMNQLVTATPIFNNSGSEIEYMIIELNTLDKLQKEYETSLLPQSSLEDSQSFSSKEPEIPCKNKQMKSLAKTAKSIADIDVTILITGETGTGKQVFVDYIHNVGKWSTKELIQINCASIPENLFESELFGYEKGSFTGALKTGKAGLLEIGKNGIIFLDEINSMPLSMQGKLLRVLETKQFSRIGSSKIQELSCRFIAATNKDLKSCIKEGTFREDLYYRLNILTLEIPPLRERKDDIVYLTNVFFHQFCDKYHVIKYATPDLIHIFLNYDWPGNVRELRNMVEKIIILSPPEQIYIDELPESIQLPKQSEKADSYPMPEHIYDYMDFYETNPEKFSLKTCIESYESSIIKSFMESTQNTYKTAQILKTNQSTIARKIQKYGIHYKHSHESAAPNRKSK